MKITLIDAGKRFNRDWIFRHLNYEFHPGRSYAITGPNGSGKSTLLQLIGGAVGPSEGSITYEQGTQLTPSENVFKHISLSAPYLELIEEMTLPEFLDFHAVFKPFLAGIQTAGIIARLGLEGTRNKQLRNFSSGMKQRVKLAQAIFSDTRVVLLDEPCTNLDTEGIGVYQKIIQDYCQDRMVIVSSNDQQEYAFCTERISLTHYK